MKRNTTALTRFYLAALFLILLNGSSANNTAEPSQAPSQKPTQETAKPLQPSPSDGPAGGLIRGEVFSHPLTPEMATLIVSSRSIDVTPYRCTELTLKMVPPLLVEPRAHFSLYHSFVYYGAEWLYFVTPPDQIPGIDGITPDYTTREGAGIKFTSPADIDRFYQFLEKVFSIPAVPFPEEGRIPGRRSMGVLGPFLDVTVGLRCIERLQPTPIFHLYQYLYWCKMETDPRCKDLWDTYREVYFSPMKARHPEVPDYGWFVGCPPNRPRDYGDCIGPAADHSKPPPIPPIPQIPQN